MLFLTCKERIIRNISNSYQAEGHLANENVNCRLGKVSGFSCLLSNRKHFLQKYDSQSKRFCAREPIWFESFF